MKTKSVATIKGKRLVIEMSEAKGATIKPAPRQPVTLNMWLEEEVYSFVNARVMSRSRISF